MKVSGARFWIVGRELQLGLGSHRVRVREIWWVLRAMRVSVKFEDITCDLSPKISSPWFRFFTTTEMNYEEH